MNDRDDTAWESAMSRDFDARVRDLNEAPLDLASVKGKAVTIRRNRRIALAGGVLAAAAVIIPIAAIAANNGTNDRPKVPIATNSSDGGAPSPSDPTATDTAIPDKPVGGGADYVLGDIWYRADGTQVELPRADYDSAVVWDDQLVATRYDGEAFAIADVIDPDDGVVDAFGTTGPVVADSTHALIAWVGVDGHVMVRSDEVEGSFDLGQVGLGSSGEGVAWSAAAVWGSTTCHAAAGGCAVFLNSGLGEDGRVVRTAGTAAIEVTDAKRFTDASTGLDGAGLVSVFTDVSGDPTCGGLYDLAAARYLWQTCDYQVQQISPDGNHVAAPPSYFDGLGPTSISILDTSDGHETGRFAPEGGFIGTWAWSADGRLVFDTYDGASWHLMAMKPDGEIEELTDPVKAGDSDSPFTLVQE